mgnify:CR=1 FL=1
MNSNIILKEFLLQNIMHNHTWWPNISTSVLLLILIAIETIPHIFSIIRSIWEVGLFNSFFGLW